MIQKIHINSSLDASLDFILSKLPLKVKSAMRDYLESKKICVLNEIRIYASSFVVFVANRTTIETDIFVSKDAIEDIVVCLCGGSVYAHLNTIKDGYISIGKGIRAGICGRAVLDNSNTVTGISEVKSINIRLPQRIAHAGDFVHKLLSEHSFNASLILYSVPGVGKTTILRDLVCLLSKDKPPIRHAIIDAREEISPFLNISTCSDIYLSYPKGLAIELATKSMAPQLIICDEITSMQEAKAILESVNSGVSFVATTHAKNFNELMSKEIIKPLIHGNVFDYAVGIKRNQNNKFEYKVDSIKWKLLARF